MSVLLIILIQNRGGYTICNRIFQDIAYAKKIVLTFLIIMLASLRGLLFDCGSGFQSGGILTSNGIGETLSRDAGRALLVTYKHGGIHRNVQIVLDNK